MKFPVHSSRTRLLGLGALVVTATLVAGCERPPTTTVQRGFRGTGMEAVYNPRTLAAVYDENQLPEVQAPASPDGPKAGEIYQNVQVLKDLSVGEFTRVMLAMTAWVAPADQSCTYCHQGEMSSDGLYTKVVARRMLQMTREINTKWTAHVGKTGVTCYTCHHGQQSPAKAWFTDPGPAAVHGVAAGRVGKNIPARIAGLSSLPFDPLTPFLVGSEQIRDQGPTALPTGNRQSIKQMDWTYSLMMYFSSSLGVNCTYCHNTASFQSWDMSPPTRVTAWHGIRMVRDLNNHYMLPLTQTLPADQRGPTGDVGKVGCATCHRGVYKPLFGESMLKDYPELGAPRTPPPAAEGVTATSATAAQTAAPKTL